MKRGGKKWLKQGVIHLVHTQNSPKNYNFWCLCVYQGVRTVS